MLRLLSGRDVGRSNALADKFQVPICGLVGFVQVLADKGASQVGPSQVEIPVNSLHPSSFSGVPSTGMEILNVFF